MPRTILRESISQWKREYNIKGCVHVRTGRQVDFTQMPKTKGNLKFLLVFVDTFSGWVEAYPTRTEKMTEVAKLLLKEIILPWLVWLSGLSASW